MWLQRSILKGWGGGVEVCGVIFISFLLTDKWREMARSQAMIQSGKHVENIVGQDKWSIRLILAFLHASLWKSSSNCEISILLKLPLFGFLSYALCIILGLLIL